MQSRSQKVVLFSGFISYSSVIWNEQSRNERCRLSKFNNADAFNVAKPAHLGISLEEPDSTALPAFVVCSFSGNYLTQTTLTQSMFLTKLIQAEY